MPEAIDRLHDCMSGFAACLMVHCGLCTSYGLLSAYYDMIGMQSGVALVK